jgi:hypothetical protein
MMLKFHSYLSVLGWSDVGMEIKVKEESQNGTSVENESPLHPQRKWTLHIQGL